MYWEDIPDIVKEEAGLNRKKREKNVDVYTAENVDNYQVRFLNRL